MRISDAVEWLLLGALWGGAFLFMRIAAPVIGPVWLIELRVLIAGLALLPGLICCGAWREVQDNLLPLMVVGCFSAALPFSLFAFSATSLSTGLNAILCATIPIFGTVVATLCFKECLTRKRFIGVLLGFAGVVVLVGWQDGGGASIGVGKAVGNFPWEVGAALLGSLLYASVVLYTKRQLSGVSPITIATASQLSAALFLLPALPFTTPDSQMSAVVIRSVVALAILSTAIADLLFFRLVRNVGSAKALTSTYLIPIFATIWGAIALQEEITAPMLIGCGLILSGTAIANDLSKFSPFKKLRFVTARLSDRSRLSEPMPIALQSEQLASRLEDIAGCSPIPISSYFSNPYVHRAVPRSTKQKSTSANERPRR